MKTLLKIIIAIAVIAGAVYWFVLRTDDTYTLESAIAIAEQGECAGYGTMSEGVYYEDWGVWYVDIEIPESYDPKDYEFVYTCEVNVYSGESRLIVDKGINWFESDYIDPVVDEQTDDTVVDQPIEEPVVDDELGLTLEEAQLIAMSSECVQIGRLTNEDDMYNNTTGTWWLGLDLFPEEAIEGCNPACVVSDSDLTAEVNWRCTGALDPAE